MELAEIGEEGNEADEPVEADYSLPAVRIGLMNQENDPIGSFPEIRLGIEGAVNYINAELAWYESQSTNINDIYIDKDPPKAWQMTANRHGEINSNYGHLIFSDKYHNQFDQVVNELRKNKDSRRASMVYQRPSIWLEYNDQCKNDFICTNSVTYYIRDNQLHCVVQMRSNDVIFGYRNDFAWQEYVLCALADELGVDDGEIYWQVQNLHIYERHFDLVK